MNAWVRLGQVATRVATQTSVIRTRAEDSARVERNGGPNGTLDHRVAAAVTRLENVAERLEQSIS